MVNEAKRTIEILLVEDNPGDVRLVKEALKESKIHNSLALAEDGVEALAILQREGKYADMKRPDIILLDLKLPKKSGHEVLEEIKKDENLRRIPVVILTSSRSEDDVIKSYSLNANCYIVKPVDLDQFINAIKYIEDFWLNVARMPQG